MHWFMAEVAMKAFAFAAVLGLAFAPLFGGSNGEKKTGPVYDTTTVMEVIGTVAEVKEVPAGNAMEGIHLTVKVKGEALDIYVGPAEFVKMFDVKFKKDDDVQVVGSKAKFEGADVLLSQEVRVGHTALVVREKDGTPYWKYFLKTIPTGL